ncbi:polymorphic toxin-type HINT domain-containing protein, partial [Leptospira kmetyi]|uniref:polymorphic toxin-type HINT domain-containing protein n=1 Tax=Leptospira kmetyi TaxID=408139 RepID=UPI00110468A5
DFVPNTCFTAGTLVHTKTGTKKIEEIEVGDQVLSWDEESGEKSYKTVTELFVHDINQLFDVEMNDNETFHTTWNHPFWVVNERSWVKVKDLKVGDIVQLKDGSEVPISKISSYSVSMTQVYNLEIEKNHTYYVGESGVLVHNYEGDNDAMSRINDALDNPSSDVKDTTKDILDLIADKAKDYGGKIATWLGGGAKALGIAIDTYDFINQLNRKDNARLEKDITPLLGRVLEAELKETNYNYEVDMRKNNQMISEQQGIISYYENKYGKDFLTQGQTAGQVQGGAIGQDILEYNKAQKYERELRRAGADIHENYMTHLKNINMAFENLSPTNHFRATLTRMYLENNDINKNLFRNTYQKLKALSNFRDDYVTYIKSGSTEKDDLWSAAKQSWEAYNAEPYKNYQYK